MKPQSLQDAIKAAALKKKSRIESGQWKEPKVKEVKVTAADMKNSEKAAGNHPRNGAVFMPAAAPASVDSVLRKEMDLLKKQMIDLQASMTTSSRPTLQAVENEQAPADNNNNNKQVQALKDEVALLKEIIREIKGLPEELSRLRHEVKSLQDQQQNQNNTTPTNSRFVDLQDFGKLTAEVVSLRDAMKKQRGELVRELNTALSKVDKQEKTIVEQQCRIEALEKQVQEALQKGKLASSSNHSKQVRPTKASAQRQKSQPETISAPATNDDSRHSTTTPPPASPVPASPQKGAATDGPPTNIVISPRKSAPLSPRKKPHHPSSPKKKSTRSDEPGSPKKKSALPQQSDRSNVARPVETATSSDENTVPLLVKKVVTDNDSGDAESNATPVENRCLPHIPTTDSSSDSSSSSSSKAAGETAERPQRRQNPRRFETHGAPERPASRDDDHHNGDNDEVDDESDDEGDGDIEIEIDDDDEEEEEEEQTSGQQQSTEQNGGAGVRGNFTRRGSMDSVDSVQTFDSMDSAPRKKTISLLPHKSIEIYEEQRKDNILRKLMMKGKTQNMKVRRVHGKNLVFFSDRVYIPAPLRQKTLEFYWKKYKKQTPLIHLEKNCFWADMEDEWKRFESDKRGRRFNLTFV